MELLNWDIWGLIAGYFAIALILASLHIYSNWNFTIKGLATVLVVGLCAVTYKSYPGLLGWPVPSSSLPSKLYLVAVEIQEPDSIYLWAMDLDRGLGDRRPRAYEVEYSKSLHEHAARAGHNIRRGIAMIAEVDAEGSVASNASGDLQTTSPASRIKFIEAPQGLLPDKE